MGSLRARQPLPAGGRGQRRHQSPTLSLLREATRRTWGGQEQAARRPPAPARWRPNPLAVACCVTGSNSISLGCSGHSESQCEGVSLNRIERPRLSEEPHSIHETKKRVFCTWHRVGPWAWRLIFLLGLWAGEAALTSIMFSRASSFRGRDPPACPWLMAPRRWITAPESSCRGRRTLQN